MSSQSSENGTSSNSGSVSSETYTSAGKKSQSAESKTKSSSEAQEPIVQKETAAVFRLRVFVVLVLVIAAVSVSFVIYHATSDSEEGEFEQIYEGNAINLINAFLNIPQHNIAVVASLGAALTAHGVDHTKSWPFVTISSFQERAASVKNISDALFLATHPIVNHTDRAEWESYVLREESNWMENARDYQDEMDIISAPVREETMNSIYYYDEENQVVFDDTEGNYMPVWQTSPLLPWHRPNENILKSPVYGKEADLCYQTASIVIGKAHTAPKGYMTDENPFTAFYANLHAIEHEDIDYEYNGQPMCNVYLPIFDSFRKDRRVAAIMLAIFPWAHFFESIIPPNVEGILIVIDNGCQGPNTFLVNGEVVEFIGEGDLHDDAFDIWERNATLQIAETLSDGSRQGITIQNDYCPMTLKIFPTVEMYQASRSNMPIVTTVSVSMVLVFSILMFLLYDRLVERRQKLILRKAMQTSAIVASLFPKAVRDRLIEEREEQAQFKANKGRNSHDIKSLLSETKVDNKTIAQLYPNATVMFADIAGFTAWSSTREPAQVFTLLQTVYQAFDDIAKKRKVFKVETIGDSYVAVTGLPDPQPNHAIIMGRFASECLTKMNQITKDLEVTLGPDTGDLTMRFGMNSGPVTGGVLRGDRARFQLFGDTVNTAARMESTGVRSKIQISQSTAQLLLEAGKDHWVSPRKDAVNAKGKGILKTFWLNPHARTASSVTGSTNSGSDDEEHFCKPQDQAEAIEKLVRAKKERLVDWVCELLQERIKAVIASRDSVKMEQNAPKPNMVYHGEEGKIALDEVVDAIPLPRSEGKQIRDIDTSEIELDPSVKMQLQAYIATIASTYHDNPFHNFEHACHVTMSVSKLLSRITTPDCVDDGEDSARAYTYGINSDPITLLAIVFSGITHDADHRGCSNTQLMKEEKDMADLYRNISIAEQNSLEVSWKIFMMDQFKDLRNCIFESKKELKRFRQVMVNVVMATDIFDKDLMKLRADRWSKAFSADGTAEVNIDEINDMKATIVMEHIIQASDVAHTMQHWHVYSKWNRRLFHELYLAYRAGRMGADPSTFWYKGEIGFFDHYVIPLAKKLKECQVFGVSSDECLSYALKNREEWIATGSEIVEEMINELNPMTTILEDSAHDKSESN